jgi:hypothetical protein
MNKPPPSTELPDPWLITTYVPRNFLITLIYPNCFTLNEVVGKMAAEMEATCKRIRAVNEEKPPERPSAVTIDQVCEWLRNCGRMLTFRTYGETSRNWKEYIRERRKVYPYPLNIVLEPDKGLACFRPIVQCELPDLGPLKPVQCALRLSPTEKGEVLDIIPVGFAAYEDEYKGAWDDPDLYQVREKMPDGINSP